MLKKIILSGMRPTGKLHIGHWAGALSNWVNLQEQYDCFFMVADWHALMSEYKNPTQINEFCLDNVAAWLAWGIDPKKAVVFIQSQVPQHLELFMLFSAITPLGWLSRCPTFKEQLKQLKEKDVNTYAFLGYPVLQSADIALYNADYVPVGDDQLPHLELAREIIRRFHFLYNKEIFIEPAPLLTSTARLLGFDGRKMSKSYNNALLLDENDASLDEKIGNMITDPQRIRKDDKGHPDICSAFNYYMIFKPENIDEVRDWCQNAQRGCCDCKKNLAGILKQLIAPHREKKNEFLKNKDYVLEVLADGKQRAQAAAQKTISRVRAAMEI